MRRLLKRMATSNTDKVASNHGENRELGANVQTLRGINKPRPSASLKVPQNMAKVGKSEVGKAFLVIIFFRRLA